MSHVNPRRSSVSRVSVAAWVCEKWLVHSHANSALEYAAVPIKAKYIFVSRREFFFDANPFLPRLCGAGLQLGMGESCREIRDPRIIEFTLDRFLLCVPQYSRLV